MPHNSANLTRNTYPCPNHPHANLVPMPTSPTLEQIAEWLGRQRSTFLASLAAYFAARGTFTPKQERHARRAYNQAAHLRQMYLASGRTHDWGHTETRYGNVGSWELGTYRNVQVYTCTRCGEVRETVEWNNYSGD